MRKYRPTFNDTALARWPGGVLVPHRVFTALRIALPIAMYRSADLHPHDARLALVELSCIVSPSNRDNNGRNAYPIRS